MRSIIDGISSFQGSYFPERQAVYERLVQDGQHPSALVIACSDSRVTPELITQAGPGDLFIARNAGNIVPASPQQELAVSAAIEYAVAALGVRDIVVCGHSDCGAMKGLLKPEALKSLPTVAAWLRHSAAAERIVCEAYPEGLDPKARLRAVTLENVLLQLNHLRAHPSVAAGLSKGELRLHGWYFEIDTGDVLAYDGQAGRFASLSKSGEFPVAFAPAAHHAAPEVAGAGATAVA